MDKIIVGIAEGKIAKGDQVLVSYALGSCVGVCLYDWQEHIAGMAHVILPCTEYAADKTNLYKFADQGVRELIREMERHGARKGRMTAKIAGGARMFETSGNTMDIGQRNVEAVRCSLEQEGIKLTAQDTGRNYGRTISFHAGEGTLKISTVRHADIML